MCGIIGIASQAPVFDRDWLTAGRDNMLHRGPDGSGEWWSDDGYVGLGHRRLAIIDLSLAGHQPMHDVRNELHLVFNGEIYNFLDLRQELAMKGYSFCSHSDTEVILAAYREWDIDCLSRLNGMFSFALYDSRKQEIFIARDRAGEKPLFYTVNDNRLCFSSELKGLMANPILPRLIDRNALDCYLAMGFVPGDRCILQGVKKLPPAHALVFNLKSGQSHLWRYWQLPELDLSEVDETDNVMLLDELETVLEDAVRRQLVADVPVGVLLSGGVDSSLITAMAVRSTPRVKTFTVRFPGHDRYDETKHARLIAQFFGTEHVELEATDSTVDLMSVLARQFDEPIADSSMIPTYLVSRLIREHCTVALGGDGGDELFGGYGHYSRLLWLHRNIGWIPLSLRSSVSRISEVLLPVGFKGRNLIQGLGTDFQVGSLPIGFYFDRRSRNRLMAKQSSLQLTAESIREQRSPLSPDLLQRATRMDFGNYLAEDILVKVDRASMLSSLEVRAPFLDYRVIEFAFGRVPTDLKATPLSRKILLKKLCERVLPPEFDQHRKQGFSIPLAHWLQDGPWHDFFHNVLSNVDSSIFDKKFVNDLLRGQRNGRSNSERLFSLALFELWRQEYEVSY